MDPPITRFPYQDHHAQKNANGRNRRREACLSFRQLPSFAGTSRIRFRGLAAISGRTLSAPRTPGNVYKMVSRERDFQDRAIGANAILSPVILNRSQAESTILRKERLPE